MANNELPTYEDINASINFQKDPGVSEVAKSKMAAATVQAQSGTVESFFAEERAKTRQQVALEEARATTAQMKTASDMKNRLFDKSLANERALESLDARAKQELLAAEKNFKYDSLGRKILTERQLSDWYSTKAQREEDWQGFSQRQQQLHDRKIQMLQTAYKKIEEAEKNAYATFGAELSRSVKTSIVNAKAALNKKIAKAKANAAKSAAMTSALGTAGAAIGGIAGGVMGAAAGGVGAAPGAAIGAGIGGAIGTGLGTAINQQDKGEEI